MGTILIDLRLGFLVFLLIATQTKANEATCDVVQIEGGTFVNCSHRLLTSLPGNLPDDTVWLDLSHNELSDLKATLPRKLGLQGLSIPSQLTNFLGLKCLKKLDLSYNRLTYVPRHAFLGLYRLEELHLNHNYISEIYPTAFQGLVSLQTLDLHSNNIRVLQPDVFYDLTQLRALNMSNNRLQSVTMESWQHLHNLRRLSVSYNRVSTLNTGAFAGLHHLQLLDLSNNQITFDSQSIPHDIFQPLKSLTDLYLHNNNLAFMSQYPDNIFRPPRTLEVLSLDTNAPLYFGSDFATIVNLKVLILNAGQCQIGTITNKSFEVFHNSSLEEIHVGSCMLVKIDICSFCFLPNLKVLRLDRNSLPGLKSALDSLYGLQGNNMTVLDLSFTSDIYFASSELLDDIGYLLNICVRHLYLSHNWLQTINYAMVDYRFPFIRCIEELDLSENRIFLDYQVFINILTFATNLVTFRMDNQFALQASTVLCRTVETDCTPQESLEMLNLTVNVLVPPNLTHLNMSGSWPSNGKFPTTLSLMHAKSLKTVDLSNSWCYNCRTAVLGAETLEWFSIRGSDCSVMNEDIFDGFSGLRHLDMSFMRLNPTFFFQRAWRVFQNLAELRELDLTYNDLLHVDPNMLRAQLKLTSLSLASNRLTAVSVNLQLHQNLTLLDLSRNMMPTLLLDERRVLDERAASHVIYVRLRGNPLLCACSSLDFVLWLSTTKVSLDGDHDNGSPSNFTCFLDTGDVSNTADILANFDYHWRQCIGPTVLGVAVSLFLVLMLGLLSALLVARSWGHIRYYWKVMRRHRLPRREHYQWDAFLGYAADDVVMVGQTVAPALEDRFKVRLRIPDRDDLPGSHIAENIVENLEKSWKVLLLVTTRFTSSEWCGFTVLQAQRSIRDAMPGRVLVVFLQDPAHLQPMASLNHLLDMIPDSCVFHVCPDTPPLHEAWENIAKAILHQNL